MSFGKVYGIEWGGELGFIFCVKVYGLFYKGCYFVGVYRMLGLIFC